MEAWEIWALVVAGVVFVALIWAMVQLRRRRQVEMFELEAVDRQERAADREAEADAIAQEAERDRRLAEEAAQRAREMQAEADARAERALASEADADVVRSEAAEELDRARDARAEAEQRR